MGAEVPLTFYRDGKSKSVTVTIEELPPAPEVLTSLGFRVQARPAPDGSETLVEINQVVNGSVAFQAGLRPGMRILKVGEEPVNSLAQFEVAVRQAGFQPRLAIADSDDRRSRRPDSPGHRQGSQPALTGVSPDSGLVHRLPQTHLSSIPAA